MNGSGIQGAIVNLGSYTDTTNVNGDFSIYNIIPGYYSLSIYIQGYDPITGWWVEIIDGESIFLDCPVPCDNFSVDPLNISVTLEPNATTSETITITNGTGEPVSWSAELNIITGSNSDDFLDLQFQYPLTGTDGQKGIECDGEYFWVTSISGTLFQYALDGTLVASYPGGWDFSDLAYNGYYFYGADGNTTVFEMDFSTQTIVSTFTAPGDVSAIAYNHDDNVFYGHNWNSDLMIFDQSGILLGVAPVGPLASYYTSFAYDNASEGGPYLWGYGLVGTDPNVLVQMELPSMQETGLTLSLSTVLQGTITNGAGGLFSHPDIIEGTWTLSGIVIDEWIWGLEIGPEESWISIEPTSGTLMAGETNQMTVDFDATNVLPWIYEAEIEFTTSPDVGSPVVEVTMEVEGPLLPYNIVGTVNCTDIDVTWDMLQGNITADSFGVYRNSELIAYVVEQFYNDPFLFPQISYQYSVSAFFGPDQSPPVDGNTIVIPEPEDLAPANFEGWIEEDNVVCFSWQCNACLEPQAYNFYMDGELTAVLFEPEYCDTLPSPTGMYEFYVAAVYYFGESDPSNSVYIIGPSSNNLASDSFKIEIYPNPAKDKIHIQSQQTLTAIQLISNSGQLVLKKTIRNNNYFLDVSVCVRGIYYLILEMDNGKTLQKVLIE